MTQDEKAGQGTPVKDAGGRAMSEAAKRALAEAEARRAAQAEVERPKEVHGRNGPEPTRYGDWETKGIVSDF